MNKNEHHESNVESNDKLNGKDIINKHIDEKYEERTNGNKYNNYNDNNEVENENENNKLDRDLDVCDFEFNELENDNFDNKNKVKEIINNEVPVYNGNIDLINNNSLLIENNENKYNIDTDYQEISNDILKYNNCVDNFDDVDFEEVSENENENKQLQVDETIKQKNEENSAKIKNIMSTINIKPPKWAER